MNGSVGSSSQNLEDYAALALADASGNIAITYQGVTDTFTPAGVALAVATPEPATWGLLALALGAVAGTKRIPRN